MPPLPNLRQERFCQLLKQGVPPYRAYPEAGYAPHPDNCYRLRENERIKARIGEISQEIAMKTQVTVETLTEELNEAAELARRVDQPAAMTAAITAKAKLHGLMVDRKETGNPGDFAGLKTADEVLAVIREQLGDGAANAIQAALAPSESPPGPSPGLDRAENNLH